MGSQPRRAAAPGVRTGLRARPLRARPAAAARAARGPRDGRVRGAHRGRSGGRDLGAGAGAGAGPPDLAPDRIRTYDLCQNMINKTV